MPARFLTAVAFTTAAALQCNIILECLFFQRLYVLVVITAHQDPTSSANRQKTERGHLLWLFPGQEAELKCHRGTN